MADKMSDKSDKSGRTVGRYVTVVCQKQRRSFSCQGQQSPWQIFGYFCCWWQTYLSGSCCSTSWNMSARDCTSWLAANHRSNVYQFYFYLRSLRLSFDFNFTKIMSVRQIISDCIWIQWHDKVSGFRQAMRALRTLTISIDQRMQNLHNDTVKQWHMIWHMWHKWHNQNQFEPSYCL